MSEKSDFWQKKMVPVSEAISELDLGNSISPITVIGTEKIRETFDHGCLQQAVNSRLAPGVSQVVLNPDAHLGYGAPVGCVLISPSHVYPGPVGVDIKCSMSLLQTDVPEDALASPQIRRRLIEAICERTPTGRGKVIGMSKKLVRSPSKQDGMHVLLVHHQAFWRL